MVNNHKFSGTMGISRVESWEIIERLPKNRANEKKKLMARNEKFVNFD